MKNKLTKCSEKSKNYLLSLSLFLSGLLTNPVYADDPFAKAEALGQQGITKIQGIGIVCFSVALVATGLAYGFGGRELKGAIKKHWVAIAIGIITVAAGPSLVEWFTNFVKG